MFKYKRRAISSMRLINMLALTTILSLAALVSADTSFTLFGKGDGFDHKLLVADNKLGFANNGQFTTFTLSEPSGYLSASGMEVVASASGFVLSRSERSKDFGITQGVLRFGTSNMQFFACPEGTAYTLQMTQCPGGSAIQLVIRETRPTDLLDQPAIPPTLPASITRTQNATTFGGRQSNSTMSASTRGWSNTTVTRNSSTVVTITSCDEVCTTYTRTYGFTRGKNNTTEGSATKSGSGTSSGTSTSMTSTAPSSSVAGGGSQAGLAAAVVAVVGALLL